MKIPIFSLLLGVAFSIKCYKQTPSLKREKEGGVIPTIEWPGIGWEGLLECGTILTLGNDEKMEDFACHSSKLAGTLTKPAWNWFELKFVDTLYTWETKSKGCVHGKVCDKIVGSRNGCRIGSWKYDKWYPTSCDRDNDFDAYEENYETQYYLACCDDVDQCNKELTYEECLQEPSFVDYLVAMQACWNEKKKDFMSTLLCDADSKPTLPGLNFAQNCTEEDGSWKEKMRSKIECKYRNICTDEIRDHLVKFGECACKAATDTGYTGEFIGTAMETQWSHVCPSIELSCASDTGLVELIYNYFVVKFQIKVKKTKEALALLLDKIKSRVAVALNTDEDTLTITINYGSNDRRRLAEDESILEVDWAVDDPDTATHAEGEGQEVADAVGDETGADATLESTDKEDANDVTEGTFKEVTQAPGDDDDDDDGDDDDVNKEKSAAVKVYTLFVWCLVVIMLIK